MLTPYRIYKDSQGLYWWTGLNQYAGWAATRGFSTNAQCVDNATASLQIADDSSPDAPDLDGAFD